MGLDAAFNRITGPGEDDYERVASFRKVNFLHRWVEQHLLDGAETNCEDVPLDLEQLAGLAQTCHQVLADHDLAPELLPTTSGFFFGGTDYDEWYFTDVQEVLDACHTILLMEKNSERPGEGRYVYWSWW